MPHGAVARDLRLLLVVQALRAFAYGAGSVLIGSALAASGRSGLQAGAVFAAMLAGNSLASLLVGMRAERVGRRRLYRWLLALMGAAGAAFALTEATPLLLLAALTGTLSTDPNESGPITSLEQAMIAEAPRTARIRTFGRYNAVAYLAGAAGSLLAGVPAALREADPAVPPDRWWLLLFPVVAAASVGVAGRLSPRVEASGSPAGAARPLGSSRSTVARLASLFALDAFAG
ncbi:MAG TPA: MFS transporter, partial [Actinomycetota bacterium]|nr:MFS transporter [Actinomycetota bacterium]